MAAPLFFSYFLLLIRSISAEAMACGSRVELMGLKLYTK